MAPVSGGSPPEAVPEDGRGPGGSVCKQNQSLRVKQLKICFFSSSFYLSKVTCAHNSKCQLGIYVQLYGRTLVASHPTPRWSLPAALLTSTSWGSIVSLAFSFPMKTFKILPACLIQILPSFHPPRRVIIFYSINT